MVDIKTETVPTEYEYFAAPKLDENAYLTAHVTDWQEVIKLGKAFPNLENLVLLDNPIENVNPVDESLKAFSKLRSLNLSGTQIKDWSELEKLRQFPSLKELRTQDIPLLQVYFIAFTFVDFDI